MVAKLPGVLTLRALLSQIVDVFCELFSVHKTILLISIRNNNTNILLGIIIII